LYNNPVCGSCLENEKQMRTKKTVLFSCILYIGNHDDDDDDNDNNNT